LFAKNPKRRRRLKPEEDNFDWDNDPAVIIRDQAAVAVIHSPSGELVIRQRDTLGAEAILYVAPENIPQFLKGLSDRASRLEPVTSVVQLTTRLTVIKGGVSDE
jgi:hypothetical protein